MSSTLWWWTLGKAIGAIEVPRNSRGKDMKVRHTCPSTGIRASGYVRDTDARCCWGWSTACTLHMCEQVKWHRQVTVEAVARGSTHPGPVIITLQLSGRFAARKRTKRRCAEEEKRGRARAATPSWAAPLLHRSGPGLRRVNHSTTLLRWTTLELAHVRAKSERDRDLKYSVYKIHHSKPEHHSQPFADNTLPLVSVFLLSSITFHKFS